MISRSINCIQLITKNNFKFSSVQLEVLKEQRVATLTLQNPKKRNPLDNSLISDLKQALQQVQDQFMRTENYPKIAVIQSEGPVFSAGHNLKDIAKFSEKEQTELFSQSAELIINIKKMTIPVLASVQGLATAAGCQLVAACDMAVASEKSQFSVPGVKIGLFCTTPGVSVARSFFHKKKLFEMLSTGEHVNAEEALQFGLINQIIKDNGDINSLRKQTLEFCSLITRNSAETIALGKEAFYKQIDIVNLEEAYKYAIGKMVENLQQEDCKEGIGSFIEKRKPKFKN